MALTAAVAFLALLGQAPISLEIKAERLELAAPKIALALGLPQLYVGQHLKNDVIMFRATNVPAEEVKAKLGKVLNATFINRPEGWFLDQTDAQRSADQLSHTNYRMKQFTKLVASCRKAVGEMKPFDETAAKTMQKELEALSKTTNSNQFSGFWRRITQVDRKGPLQRLAHKIAARLEAKDWMPVDEENRIVVYSLNPTKMQKPLPFRIDDLVNEAIEGQNIWSSFAGGTELQGPRARSEDGDDDEGYYWLGATNSNRKPLSITDFKNIIIKLSWENQSINVAAFGKDDQQLFDTGISSYDFREEEPTSQTEESYNQRLAKRKPLSPEAKEFMQAIGYEQQVDNKPAPMSPGLKQKLLNPETSDPLSIATYEIVSGALDNKNFALMMRDEFMFTNMFDPAMYTLGADGRFEVTTDDRWMVMTDADLVDSRRMRFDRKKLGNLMRFMDTNKREMTIEERADFFLSIPRYQENAYTINQLLNIMAPNSVKGSYQDPAGYRIFGAMTDGERKAAQQAPISLSRLSSVVHKNLFQEMFMVMYGTYPQLDYPQDGNQEDVANYSKLANKIYSGLMQEKTFMMPNGLTGEMQMKLTDETERVLSCTPPKGNRYMNYRTMRPHELGMYMFRKTNPKKYRWEVDRYNAIDENMIFLASKRTVTVKLMINKYVSFSWTMAQAKITDTKQYTASNLPEDVMKEVKQGYKDAEEQDKYYYSGTGQRGNPPPP